MADITTPEGSVATTQGGTVYIKRAGDWSRFVWGGPCLWIGDITDERGGLNVTTRANEREGGLRRDGVLVDPPGNVSTTLSMKRLQSDKLKTHLRNCFWHFDKRTQCNNFDDPLFWREIERVYRAKVGTRTTTPGTAIMESNTEDMVNFDVTALNDYDIYRVNIESGSVQAGAPHDIVSLDVCHGERCVNCGDPETDAVLVAGTELVAAGSPHIYVNTEGGDIASWTDIAVTEWVAGDVNGIVCLGDWGAAVSADEGANGEVLYSRDRFVTRVAYALSASHPPLAIDASSQTFIVFAGEDGYIYISRDGMVSYETSLAGTITILDLTGVKIAPSNHNVVYVWSSADDVILKTENAGDTWFQTTLTSTAGGILSLEVHPDDENMVIVGTDNGELFQSLDGCETWTQQGDLMGMTTKANANISSISAAPGGVWGLAVSEAGVYSRVYLNYEDGASGAWEYSNPISGFDYAVATALIVRAIAAVDVNRFVAVGGDNAAADLVALIA